MDWLQDLVATAVAVAGGWYAWSTGETLGTTIVVVALCYFGLRLCLAWAARTRYWVRNAGTESRSCPHCGQYVYRLRGDWMLTCHRCGWRPGVPGLRWMTRSVPSHQLQRTVWSLRGVLAVGAAVLLITGGAAGVTIGTLQHLDVPTVGAHDAGDGPAPGTSVDGPSTTDAGGVGTSATDGLNATAIERAIHREINAVRADRGLKTLSWDPALAEIAHYHSRDMVENAYFAHTAPDGETVEDRYEQFGYDCRVSTGEASYVTGGENIAYVYANRYDDAEAVATRIVDLWMASEGHRKNILREYWNNEGLGVVIGTVEGERRVYVTQNFC